MYVQWFVKGILGTNDPTSDLFLTRQAAFWLISSGGGISSNWWRNKGSQPITPPEIQDVLTEQHLDRHLHDYDRYGHETPFISLAAGSVERDTMLKTNTVHSAIDTALWFATKGWTQPGALFYGWTVASLNPAVPISTVAESVRDLNIYQQWSRFNLEGEVTAKIYIPANQIERVEWWDGAVSKHARVDVADNDMFVNPEPILNVRKFF
jgi:hypothetical protein